ncbi:hypothetical protein [Roseicella aquatilis]|uniref:Uncharacterized protein n=1 Tax=Roseicella aquatilis TaxID=2527868 RepID=A0A4R4DU66_9PROT|nr:hypothetical protein [Roseicella aquatilis]TCZ63690.1 hypothetical protein EXY23_09920 [Roseicella aquatilis]
MVRQDRRAFVPGASVLGGAAGGLSYEGMMRDAVAAEERARRQEAGWSRGLRRTPVQVQRPESDRAAQARVAGR